MSDATQFLKANRRAVRRPLGWAAGAAAAGALLLVGQYLLLASILDAVVFAGASLDTLWPHLQAMLAVILARSGLAWAGERAAITAAGQVKHRVRDALLAQLFALGPVRLAGERSGDLAALLVEGVEALEPYYARFVPALLTIAVVPLAILAVVTPLDWVSALVLALTAPLIPLFMIMIGKGAERLNQRQWARLARMGAHFLEVIQNLTTLKLFDASRGEAAIIARISEDYRLATMSVLRVAFLSALVLEFLATMSIALVAVFIGFRLLAGTMDYQRGLFILLLAPEFYLPLRSLGSQYHARMEAVAAATRMVEILSRPVPSGADTGPAASGVAADARVVFDNVHLRYGDGRVGLAGCDLCVEPGTITALVGPSGGGKSSIVSALLGFASPESGRILIDGTPLDAIALAQWRRHLAWVPQRPTLIRASIADNIGIGFNPDNIGVGGTADLAHIRAAARLTGADTFISALPAGYDSPVGEHGRGLSGGQARLIALTRAVLHDASLLILDEPTASLDQAGQMMVDQAIASLRGRHTILVIAHRLETARLADRIAVIEAGRVVESGSHHALIAAEGAYARMVRTGQENLDTAKPPECGAQAAGQQT